MLLNNTISTGSELINSLLEGGYEKDIITTIYGPAGSGKSCLCQLCMIDMALSGKKVIYVDTEGGFSVRRTMQITPEFKKVFSRVLFFKPTSFDEQKRVFNRLKKIVDDKIGLIVIDTIGMLYRLELGKNEDVYKINRELGKQISYLNEISRKKGIPVLITNQVYANFEYKDKVNMVGGDILKYGSKCLIELMNLKNKSHKAVLIKHRSIKKENEIEFNIVDKGIE